MQFAHTLENREIFNVFRLDVVGECVVVGTFAFWLLVGFGCERYVFGNDSLEVSTPKYSCRDTSIFPI